MRINIERAKDTAAVFEYGRIVVSDVEAKV
jgi:hypothetical protein